MAKERERRATLEGMDMKGMVPTGGGTAAFNLIEEPWIPVLYHDGRCARIGLQQAMDEAGSIRQIAASNPMDRVALLRFLLAMLYWCRGNPTGQEEKDRILAAGRFPVEWFGKLQERRECFNLLGDGKRFNQNEAYRRIAPEHTVDYLIHEVPSGTNKWHFRHATDFTDGLCPACCALGLIRLPVFATSAGRGMSASTGKSPGINSKPPLYVLPVGKSLAEYLLLSWRFTPLALGMPEWETPGLKLPPSGEVPLLTGLTWLPRNIWLVDPEEPASTCILCGRVEPLIKRCVFDGTGSSKAESRIWRDPHVIYDAVKADEVRTLQTSDALGASDAASSQWAKTAAGILRDQEAGEQGTVWVVGFSTVQNDKYLEATEGLLPCSGQDNESAARFEQWRKEGATLTRKLCPKGKSSARELPIELRPAVDAIRPEVEARVSAGVRELLVGNVSAWESAAHKYHPMMEVIGKSLSPGFTTRALQRRNQISNVVPDMSPGQNGLPRKSKAKKQGDQ